MADKKRAVTQKATNKNASLPKQETGVMLILCCLIAD